MRENIKRRREQTQREKTEKNDWMSKKIRLQAVKSEMLCRELIWILLLEVFIWPDTRLAGWLHEIKMYIFYKI